MKKQKNSKSQSTIKTNDSTRRSEILRVIGRMFRENGYKGTSTRDIAHAVGILPGSLFFHFKSKHEMLRTIVIEGLHLVHAQVLEASQIPGTARERFQEMLKAHLNTLLSDKLSDFPSVAIHQSIHLDEITIKEVQKIKDAYEKIWSKVLDELQQSKDLEGNMHLVRLLLLGAMNQSTLWYSRRGPNTPEDIANQLSLLIFQNPAQTKASAPKKSLKHK